MVRRKKGRSFGASLCQSNQRKRRVNITRENIKRVRVLIYLVMVLRRFHMNQKREMSKRMNRKCRSEWQHHCHYRYNRWMSKRGKEWDISVSQIITTPKC
uniref:Uncharacterized protein n=1 Tax=Opuntia streptacantha TaxID=393608 RepID=A0A7C9ANU3_OPUST